MLHFQRFKLKDEPLFSWHSPFFRTPVGAHVGSLIDSDTAKHYIFINPLMQNIHFPYKWYLWNNSLKVKCMVKWFTSSRSNRKQIAIASVLPKKRCSLVQSPSLPQVRTPGSVQALWCSPDVLGRSCLGGRRASFSNCVCIWKNLIYQIFLHMMWFLDSDLSRLRLAECPAVGF